VQTIPQFVGTTWKY